MPQLPGGEDQATVESEAPEETMERLAHLEQLVVQLKELIRDKDSQLVQKDTELKNKDAQLKVLKIPQFSFLLLQKFFFFTFKEIIVLFCLLCQNEKEDAEARFTKLKLQAKARMASLNKQIAELKGSGGETVTVS